MSTGHVKVGLVAYSQAAPEVVVRMDKAAAREVLASLEAAIRGGTLHLHPVAVRLYYQLRSLDLERQARG